MKNMVISFKSRFKLGEMIIQMLKRAFKFLVSVQLPNRNGQKMIGQVIWSAITFSNQKNLLKKLQLFEIFLNQQLRVIFSKHSKVDIPSLGISFLMMMKK